LDIYAQSEKHTAYCTYMYVRSVKLTTITGTALAVPYLFGMCACL